jgi:hypothetical protein
MMLLKNFKNAIVATFCGIVEGIQLAKHYNRTKRLD